MAKLLYVTCNPEPVEYSASLQVGKEFIEVYKQTNSNDEIIEIDMYNVDLPEFNNIVLRSTEKMYGEGGFEKLNNDEQEIMKKRFDFLNLFMSCDKYVIAAPMWNWSYPAKMKEFIDAIVVSNQTFKIENGELVGLLENKKGVYIQATGGIYSEKPQINFGKIHLTATMKFLGVKDFSTIDVEGTTLPNNYENAVNKGKEEVRNLAKKF